LSVSYSCLEYRLLALPFTLFNLELEYYLVMFAFTVGYRCNECVFRHRVGYNRIIALLLGVQLSALHDFARDNIEIERYTRY